METQIISRVAELIRNPQASKRKEVDDKKTIEDRIEISTKANGDLAKADELDSELERMQYLKVQSVEQRINTGNYKFTDEMVDSIAEKILGLF